MSAPHSVEVPHWPVSAPPGAAEGAGLPGAVQGRRGGGRGGALIAGSGGRRGGRAGRAGGSHYTGGRRERAWSLVRHGLEDVT